MARRFDQLENDSPRSGSSKRLTPVLWFAVVAVFAIVVIWLATKT